MVCFYRSFFFVTCVSRAPLEQGVRSSLSFGRLGCSVSHIASFIWCVFYNRHTPFHPHPPPPRLIPLPPSRLLLSAQVLDRAFVMGWILYMMWMLMLVDRCCVATSPRHFVARSVLFVFANITVVTSPVSNPFSLYIPDLRPQPLVESFHHAQATAARCRRCAPHRLPQSASCRLRHRSCRLRSVRTARLPQVSRAIPLVVLGGCCRCPCADNVCVG
jgi:hypothetical protein